MSIGTHPSGVLISDLPIEQTVGLCSISTSDYPVSMINMKELDDLMYVKLDILGLDNIGVINETCKMLGIERLTPDNTDMDDMNVWKSIRDNTTLIFQWESGSAQQYMRKFMSDETLPNGSNQNSKLSMLKGCRLATVFSVLPVQVSVTVWRRESFTTTVLTRLTSSYRRRPGESLCRKQSCNSL